MPLAEYHLIISPPDYVRAQVNFYKNLLADKIGDYPSRGSIPHVTISMFETDLKFENAFLKSLIHIAAEQEAIPFTVDGFGFFETNNTVYLKIKEKKEFAELSRNLNRKTLIASRKCTWKALINFPHLTIGKNLAADYLPACGLFSLQHYTETFTATAALLLRRNPFGKDEVLQELHFLGNPQQQLPLF